jgi:hypothetical protein
MPELFSGIWDIITTISTIISMIAIVVFIYAYYRLYEVRTEENNKLKKIFTWTSVQKDKNDRWEKVLHYLSSEHPTDWKMAILEADSMLDDILVHMGYQGDTMGERMKNIPEGRFPFLNEAWNAHKVRNHIAHRGSNYAITRTEAEDTIDMYNRIFKHFGYL